MSGRIVLFDEFRAMTADQVTAYDILLGMVVGKWEISEERQVSPETSHSYKH